MAAAKGCCIVIARRPTRTFFDAMLAPPTPPLSLPCLDDGLGFTPLASREGVEK